MLQIDQQNLNSLLEVIQVANANLDEMDSFRKEVLKAIQKIIPTDSSTFFLFDPRRKPINPVALNLEEKYLNLYQSHYFIDNPFDPTNLGFPSRTVILDRNLFSLADFFKTCIYNDFFRPQKIHRQLVIFLKTHKKLLGFIGLHRSNVQKEFKESEVKLSETIAPYLTLSLEKAITFNKIKSENNFLKMVCNCVSDGVVILDFNLNPIFLNTKAQEVCACFKQKRIACTIESKEPSSLPLEIYKDCIALKQQMKNINQGLEPFYTERSILLSEMEEYSIRCEVLHQNLTQMEEPLLLITMSHVGIGETKSERMQLNEAKLKCEYDLTAREIQIIHYIYKGLKNVEIANLLNISEGTVKNHLKNIFSKMGVENRTSLIYEALSL